MHERGYVRADRVERVDIVDAKTLVNAKTIMWYRLEGVFDHVIFHTIIYIYIWNVDLIGIDHWC